jgi:hypothetical protein
MVKGAEGDRRTCLVRLETEHGHGPAGFGVAIPAYVDLALAGHVGQGFKDGLHREGQGADVERLQLDHDAVGFLSRHPHPQVERYHRTTQTLVAIAKAEANQVVLKSDAGLVECVGHVAANQRLAETFFKEGVQLLVGQFVAPLLVLGYAVDVDTFLEALSRAQLALRASGLRSLLIPPRHLTQQEHQQGENKQTAHQDQPSEHEQGTELASVSKPLHEKAPVESGSVRRNLRLHAP